MWMLRVVIMNDTLQAVTTVGQLNLCVTVSPQSTWLNIAVALNFAESSISLLFTLLWNGIIFLWIIYRYELPELFSLELVMSFPLYRYCKGKKKVKLFL
jgi:hypothetical protein